jgi:hypothetical protein
VVRELVALRDEHRRLSEDERRYLAALDDHAHQFERMFADEAALRAEETALRTVVADQDDHLRRTYAEIERLNGVVRAMESTRAWRLHQRLARGAGPR